MKIKTVLFFISFCFSALLTNGQKFATMPYTDRDTLKLDLFSPSITSDKLLPLVIYVHGGGFSDGHRTAGHSVCGFLSANGYVAASISYTLYLKGKSFGCDAQLTEKIKAMQIAASNLWEATSFFIKNYKKYNIDTTKIFIAGSSAGAETVLNAAFWDYNLMNLYKPMLSKTFKYAGLISGSGAMMDINLITLKTRLPMMLFHGNGDNIVPYATAAHRYCSTNTPGWLMFFGSYTLYNHLVGLNGTAHLFTFCGGGHEYSNELFDKDQYYLLQFLNDVVAGKKFQEHTIIPTGKKNERAEVYKFCD